MASVECCALWWNCAPIVWTCRWIVLHLLWQDCSPGWWRHGLFLCHGREQTSPGRRSWRRRGLQVGLLLLSHLGVWSLGLQSEPLFSFFLSRCFSAGTAALLFGWRTSTRTAGFGFECVLLCGPNSALATGRGQPDPRDVHFICCLVWTVPALIGLMVFLFSGSSCFR